MTATQPSGGRLGQDEASPSGSGFLGSAPIDLLWFVKPCFLSHRLGVVTILSKDQIPGPTNSWITSALLAALKKKIAPPRGSGRNFGTPHSHRSVGPADQRPTSHADGCEAVVHSIRRCLRCHSCDEARGFRPRTTEWYLARQGGASCATRTTASSCSAQRQSPALGPTGRPSSAVALCPRPTGPRWSVRTLRQPVGRVDRWTWRPSASTTASPPALTRPSAPSSGASRKAWTTEASN